MQLLVIQPRGFLVPDADPGATFLPAHREALRDAATDRTLVLLDHESPDAVDRWTLGCSRASVLGFWSGRLGRQARPPSPLVFRWLARKFGLRADECTCVGSSDWLLRGARRAGWQAVQAPAFAAGGSDALDLLHELAGR